MLNKKLLVIGVGSLLLVVLVLLLAISASRTGTPKPSGGETPPTAKLTAPPDDPGVLRVVETTPKSGQSEVEFTAPVNVEFNRSFSMSEVKVEFINSRLEPVEYKLQIDRNILTLTPSQSLDQSTAYTIRIRDQYVRLISEFSFLTKTISPSPDTRPVAAVTEAVLRNRRDYPEIYLANILPYESTDFRMERQFDDEGNYLFVVESSQLTGAFLRDRVNKWLLEQELTQIQIDELTLQYR